MSSTNKGTGTYNSKRGCCMNGKKIWKSLLGEKQVEEKMNNNKTLSDSEHEKNTRNKKRRFSHDKYKISFRSNSFLE